MKNKQLSTHTVLNNCLTMVKGKLEWFLPFRHTQQNEEEKRRLLDALGVQADELWITKYRQAGKYLFESQASESDDLGEQLFFPHTDLLF